MKVHVQRSLLILPVNVPRFVEKAYTRAADSIMLDLEDSVPRDRKAPARELVKDSIALAGRGGTDVFVRVNNEESLLREDVAASVYPGLHAIFLPKTESGKQVAALDEQIAELELERGIQPGSIKLSLHIETPLGILRLQEIAAAGKRTESMSIGGDDYCLQLGVEASPEGTELFFPFAMMATVCRATGINPMGILGSVAGYRDLDSFRRAAEHGRNLGSTGAFCIHPDQVGILNQVFSPSQHDVDHARRVVEAFEEGLSMGRASVTLEGRMVDTPVYKRAKLVMERAEAVAALEKRKAEALSRLSAEDRQPSAQPYDEGGEQMPSK
jgi:citrate lyase subunit beta / citryl-CoA lyase